MIFKISPKLSKARDLVQTYRQTVPQTRPCNSKASITNCCGFVEMLVSCQ